MIGLRGAERFSVLTLLLLACTCGRLVAADLPGGDRPVEVYVPSSYQAGAPAPLVLLLHGLALTGPLQEDYFNFKPLAEQRGFLYAYPTGTRDKVLETFWNATDACCNFYGSDVDDSGYLRDLIDEIEAQYSVDRRRIYLVGYSNGGFMAHRMACEHADKIAAIVSLAGAQFAQNNRCKPSEPVHILQVHGTADLTVLYRGGKFFGRPYPGAVETASRWAELNGCEPEPVVAPALNLEAVLPGQETSVSRWDTGCKTGGSAELWSIRTGSHLPLFAPGFSPAVIDYLLSHAK
jgi:polyhydroxybutyrate depolymerase